MKVCINIKFILFFILSIICLSFFWYFISCFCGIYKNTQTILIKDTVISYILSQKDADLRYNIIRFSSEKPKAEKIIFNPY